MPYAYTYPSYRKKERASGPDLKASVTVEAALTVPVFLFAILCLVYLLEIRTVKEKIVFAASDAAKTAAAEMSVSPILNPSEIKKNIVEAIGEDRLGRSIVDGGASGLHCGKSYFSYFTDEVHVVVEYSVSPPLPGIIGRGADFREEVKARGWTGLRPPSGDPDKAEIVYITRDSHVYHENRDCTYLRLSIRYVPFEELKWRRNIYGGKYKSCEKCVHAQPLGGVYITDSGGKYHSSLNCSGLKRTVYAVKKSEVGLRRGCFRCSQ